MKPGAFFARSGHARKIPGVLIGVESLGAILRTEDPRIIGEAALALCSLVFENQLPRGGHSDVIAVEYEAIRMANKWTM